jgi:transposase
LDPLIGKDFVWGFQDESAQRISARTARVWSVGKPVRRMNSDHINANVFGFYAINGRSVVSFPKGSKSADMCAFLDVVREVNGNSKVLMILDNGPIHRTKAVLAHAAELDITMLFLPPYSPQFNPIELIWKTIKARVSGMFLLYRDRLLEVVLETFMIESAKISYATGWMNKFFDGTSFK